MSNANCSLSECNTFQMIRLRVLISPPDTCFVIASDLTAGQFKVGDLFRHSQNVLSVFFWPVEECQPAIVVDPAVQDQSRLSMFSAFQVFKFLHRLSMFSSWTVDNLSGFLSYRHDQPKPVKLENLNLGYFAL